MSLSTTRTAIADRAGYGSNITTAVSAIIDRAINRGQRRLCREQFMCLRTPGYIQIQPAVKKYNLASDFGILDFITITHETNEIGNITAWVQDSGVYGHFDAALDDNAGEDSILQVGEDLRVIQSVTGDGTAASSVELDYALTSGTVRFISDTSASLKQVRQLKPGSLREIVDYPAKSTYDTPWKFHIEGASSTGTDAVRTVYIGSPTADEYYLCEYWYFRQLVELSDDADVSLLETLYGDDEPLLWLGLQEFYFDTKDHNKAAEIEPFVRRSISQMKRELPVKSGRRNMRANEVGGGYDYKEEALWVKA